MRESEYRVHAAAKILEGADQKGEGLSGALAHDRKWAQGLKWVGGASAAFLLLAAGHAYQHNKPSWATTATFGTLATLLARSSRRYQKAMQSFQQLCQARGEAGARRAMIMLIKAHNEAPAQDLAGKRIYFHPEA